MRTPFIAAILGLALLLPVPAAQAQRFRDQDAAIRASRDGQILPLSAILSRIRVTGAEYIGAEFNPAGPFYRLKFMRGATVIWIDVDARTGQILARSGG